MTRLSTLSPAAGLLCWTLGFVWHYWRPGSFWILDLALVPGTVLLFAFGFASVFAALITARRWLLLAAVGPVLLAMTLLVAPFWRVEPQTWFAVHRPLYNMARAVDPGTDYYGNTLPWPLRYLSDRGKVSRVSAGEHVHRDDIRFFPQWVGIPDDAGGYLYDPDGRSPEGADLYGSLCEEATDLGDGWWMCGL